MSASVSADIAQVGTLFSYILGQNKENQPCVVASNGMLFLKLKINHMSNSNGVNLLLNLVQMQTVYF